MNETWINKSRWFWAWQDEQEERWLGEMARQGFHLQKAEAFGRYTFLQGAPQEVAYRLDFVTGSKKREDYYQLFRDAGWDHVSEMSGWQYWRKEIRDDQAPEIFTDLDSKSQKYQRLMGVLLVFFPLILLGFRNVISASERYQGWVEAGLFILFTALYLIYIFAIFMLARRILTLKRKR